MITGAITRLAEGGRGWEHVGPRDTGHYMYYCTTTYAALLPRPAPISRDRGIVSGRHPSDFRSLCCLLFTVDVLYLSGVFRVWLETGAILASKDSIQT